LIRFIQFSIALIAIALFDLYIYENLPWVDDITRYKVNFQYPIVYALNSNLTTPLWGGLIVLLVEVLQISIEDTVKLLQYVIFCSMALILSFATRSTLFTILLISSLFITYSLDMVIGNLRQGIATIFILYSIIYTKGLIRLIGMSLGVLTHNMMAVPFVIYYLHKLRIDRKIPKDIEQAIFLSPLIIVIILFASNATGDGGGRSIFGLMTYILMYLLMYKNPTDSRTFYFAQGILVFVSGTYIFFDQIIRYMGSFMSIIILASQELPKERQVILIALIIISSIFLWAQRLQIG
tara:strand:- start:562 stop:1443 length:882 start_codon:yes stop_codon:yes gene_type:complete